MSRKNVTKDMPFTLKLGNGETMTVGANICKKTLIATKDLDYLKDSISTLEADRAAILREVWKLEDKARTLEAELDTEMFERRSFGSTIVKQSEEIERLEAENEQLRQEVGELLAEYEPGGKFQAVKWIHNHTLVQRLRRLVKREASENGR